MTAPPITSASAQAPAPCSPPRIVAEALVAVADPLEAALDPGPDAPADQVARSLARSLAPAESERTAPPWLRDHQAISFRRAVAALERHGGALLADPVGSGKTWVALAVAEALAGPAGALAVVPATLRDQWRHTASRAGVSLTLISHERASRGPLPDGRWVLAIVDESHRAGNPATRRYDHLARALAGRQVLLLSATPVVNRLEDLAHQLLLGARDDALAPRGIQSLLAALRRGEAPAALGDLVVSGPKPHGLPPAPTRRVTPPAPAGLAEQIAAIDRLALSPSVAVAGLIRSALWRALASSPRAAAAALARYHRLLLEAAAADAAGRRTSRGAIRRFAGADLAQLLLWELLPDADGGGAGAAELRLDDLAPVAALAAEWRARAREPDPKCARLAELVADGVATIVFTTSRETHGWLRDRLAPLGPAWVTGGGAGIGHTRLGRGAVLGHFRPLPAGQPAGRSPQILLATDVAAEGLDLQRAGRIVHYDLPWTSVRLEQRVGRARRIGAVASSVEVVEFLPPPEIESRLRQLDCLTTKRSLAVRAGLGREGAPSRWRREAPGLLGPGPSLPGMAVAAGEEEGWLAGLALDLLDERGGLRWEPAALLWLSDDGGVDDDLESGLSRLARLRGSRSRAPRPDERAAARAILLPVVRERLRSATLDLWRSATGEEGRRLAARLRREAADAARRRDQVRLGEIAGALAWLAGGLTAGEARLAAAALGADRRSLGRWLARLTARPRPRFTPVVRLSGVVRVTTFL